ncbi:hypothetical protein [Thermosipho sp. (in: thermotogales)]|jgi:hypothetical protein|nr:hypothetical protein [Thermosipho sp. (in: thermotogales)]MBZ4649243.1 hypothetical protein [Thermosipho sp. (in: thermotogales)]
MARTQGAYNKPILERIFVLLPKLSQKELQAVKKQIENLIAINNEMRKEG